MEEAVLKELLNTFKAEKEYRNDGYYRIRQGQGETYELGFLVPDSCGTTSVSPQITISKVADRWVPIKLLDFASTPMKQLERTVDTEDALDEALKALVNKFKHSTKKRTD
ncbi:hypothetical protein [Vagococcus salmoninarum]|uniref:hypothetical protein n=1 Tax=Vagococcus salmoninarum TaxID=2739 RepID=UPI003F993D9F